MVDFAKLREQSRQRAREQEGNASSTVKYIPVPKTQIEILEELREHCDLNDWEDGFCGSNIAWMTGKAEAKLSDKQNAVLQRMIVKYEIDPDKHSDIAFKQNVNAIANAALKDLDDPSFDPDTDIPF